MKIILTESQYKRIILQERYIDRRLIGTDDDGDYWVQAKENLTCKDCREWSAVDSDMFMVNDDIWNKYGNEGDQLCPGCLEKRMGRKLTRDDVSQYADAPVNIENPYIQNLTESN